MDFPYTAFDTNWSNDGALCLYERTRGHIKSGFGCKNMHAAMSVEFKGVKTLTVTNCRHSHGPNPLLDHFGID